MVVYTKTPAQLAAARSLGQNCSLAPPMDSPRTITQILQEAARGDGGAASELVNLLYDELRRIAGGMLSGGNATPTLQPTALVHEAYLRLVDQKNLQIDSRDHFLRIAARAMRFVIIDHIRTRGRDKRGGGSARVPLDDIIDFYNSAAVDMLALDESLSKLQETDEQLARIVELRFFAGFTIEETARILNISTPTVERGWRFARAYLHKQMNG